MQQMIRKTIEKKKKGQILKQNKKKESCADFLSTKTDNHPVKIFCVEIALPCIIVSLKENKNFFSELMISNFLRHARLHLPVYEPGPAWGEQVFGCRQNRLLPSLPPIVNYIHNNNALRKFSQSLLLEHNILLEFR